MNTRQRKLLAVASTGGHWIQLLRLRPAFEGCQVEYVTTVQRDAEELGGKLHVVKDANFNQKFKMMILFMQVLWVLIKVRPDVIVSTGAAPGFAAIMLGRIFGIRTVWLDSIANSEELSKSGKYAKFVANAWLTQWPNLSYKNGPQYWGSVL